MPTGTFIYTLPINYILKINKFFLVLMKVKGIDRFEYTFENLYNSINSTINRLNILGQEGWEVIELINPKSNIEPYRAWLKRKITEVEV